MIRYNKKFSIRTTESGQFAKRLVVVTFLIVVCYTIVGLYLQAKYLIPLNDTLTEWVFKFFGIEICLLMIKKLWGNNRLIPTNLKTNITNGLINKLTNDISINTEDQETDTSQDP